MHSKNLVVIAAVSFCRAALSWSFGGARSPATRRASFVASLSSARGGDDVAPGPVDPAILDDDLTSEGFGALLRDVRAHTRSQFAVATSAEAIEAQAELVDRLRRMRLPGLRLRRCEVRPSGIHGAGLFATRPIGEGELITIYPGDALLYWDEKFGGKPGPVGCELRASFGVHVPAEEQASPDLFLRKTNARDYEMQCSARRSIVGDPGRSDDAAYLGHFANDGAALFGGSDAERTAYSLASSEAANAYHIGMEGCQLVTLALRDIEADEEVLVSYGEGYWLSRAGHSVTKEAADADEARARRQGKRSRARKNNQSTKGPSKRKSGFG